METCLLSQLLFQYLSHKYGSEKDVRAIRLFYGVEDCCNVTSLFRIVSSGSKAEGLKFPGSDMDLMFIYLGKVVYPDIRYCPHNDFPSLYISIDDAQPGFAHINFRINPLGSFRRNATITFPGRSIDGIHTENGIILQNSWFKDFFHILGLPDVPGFIMKNHGPCLSTFDNLIDHVFSFELHCWPNVASGWIWRPRLFDWPSQRLISNIAHESVLLVPIGSKFGSLDDNPNEWRISFSLAEKLLVHSFNHTQLMCYVLLKILLKEILNKNAVTKNLLCSYFMKTILFWIIEETGCSAWTPNNLVKCFRACVTKLLYLLKQKYLPNYFIPENNMIEGKLSEDSLSNLCTLLETVNNEGIGFTNRSDTLQDFLTTIHWKLPIKYQADETNVLCSFLREYIFIYLYFRKRLEKICFSLNMFKDKLIRYLFYCRFLRNISFGLQKKYDLDRSNKSLYCNYKTLLGYSLISAKLCLSSWLSVGMIFYSHKNYNNTLRLTAFIQSENSLMRNLSFHFDNTKEVRLSILQRVKLMCCKSFVETTVFCTNESIMANRDICFELFYLPVSFVPLSRSFLAYLRFMCFHQLKNVSKKTNALHELIESVDEISTNINENIDTNYFHYNSLIFLYVYKACNISHMSIPVKKIEKNW